MKKCKTNTGEELLYLLKQQRYLYHQLKNLNGRQRQLAGTNSPEQMLEVISGRRKLVEKLQGLEDKLGPIRTNWQRFSLRIEPEHKTQALELANQVQEIIRELMATTPSETVQNLPLHQNWKLSELLAET